MADTDTRPEGARVTLDMIGSSTGEQKLQWNERETILYALGVGAGLGAPESELGFTTENTGGVRLRALPSLLTTFTLGQMPPAARMLDGSRFLHAEQRIELVSPLPASGEGFLHITLESVLDKGADAIIVLTTTLRGEGEDRPVIGRARMSIFVRGAGGFGGPRGTAEIYALPERAPDARVEYQTRPEQALLYRLSGDRNRLHSDPGFARGIGFERPILHGLCTYGFACRALIEGACGGNPDRLAAMGGRFRNPVYPGDTLTTEIWREQDGNVLFRTIGGAGDVKIERGSAKILP